MGAATALQTVRRPVSSGSAWSIVDPSGTTESLRMTLGSRPNSRTRNHMRPQAAVAGGWACSLCDTLAQPRDVAATPWPTQARENTPNRSRIFKLGRRNSTRPERED